MRSKLTKTIILIVFVVFLGINDVNAETCTFSYATNRINQIYVIETDSRGNVTSIQFKEVDIQTNEVKTDQNKTNELTADFVGCPDSIGVDGNTLTRKKSTYRNVDKLNNGNGNTNVGALEPGKDDSNPVKCGDIDDIPAVFPRTTKIIYSLLQVLIPVILVVLGMLDLVKAVMAQKEDEIKKGQQTLIKRLIAAAIVFFVFAIVKMVATYLADNSSVGECLNCFIKGDCEESEEEAKANAGGGGGGRPNNTVAPY